MRKALRHIGTAVRELFWIGVAGAIVAGGYFGFTYLGDNRTIVEAEPAARPETLVETVALKEYQGPLPIRGEGFVEPFRTVAVSAPTGGRIVSLHPAITNKGFFREGDILVEIDGSTERAQIAQSQASIEATDARLDLVTRQLERAQRLLERSAATQATVDDLQGQRNEIFANLQGQRAQLTSAEIALENKIVRAPFDGAVQAKEAEIGNVVAGGAPIAQIFTDGQMEVSIAIRETDAVLIPGLFTGNPAPAKVSIDFAGETQVWAGEIIRIDPALDQQTRTLAVTIALRGRLETDVEFAAGIPPVLINAFAKAVVEGIEPDNTFAIPSTALRSDNTIWLVRDGRLAFHPATRVHVDGETTYVRVTDLFPDDRLVLTSLAAPQLGEALKDISSASVTTTRVSE
ncbi:MAG: efflux RND transporter periplasmic adaptor subunit [Pseudomonadota bacterium]